MNKAPRGLLIATVWVAATMALVPLASLAESRDCPQSPDGTWRSYYDDGAPEIEAVLEAGRAVHITYFSRTGKPIDISSFVRERYRAEPGTAKHAQWVKRLAPSGIFHECSD